MPILKRTVDIAKIFYDENNKDDAVKNHILASVLLGIFNSSDTSASKSDKITSIVTLFGTSQISLSTAISTTPALSLRNAIKINFGNFAAQEATIEFLQPFVKPNVVDIAPHNSTVCYSIQDFYEHAYIYNKELEELDYEYVKLSRVKKKFFKKHGFTHAKEAVYNYIKFFPELENEIITDCINCHMFPLNKRVPKFKEGWIITFVDKKNSFSEVINVKEFVLARINSKKIKL